MKKEDRVPGLVRDDTSVNWRVSVVATSCPYMDDEWCGYHTKPKKCRYSDCPQRIKDSFTERRE